MFDESTSLSLYQMERRGASGVNKRAARNSRSRKRDGLGFNVSPQCLRVLRCGYSQRATPTASTTLGVARETDLHIQERMICPIARHA